MWWKVGVFDRSSDWLFLTIYVTGETTNIVATCGGKLVCLMDRQTGLFLTIYITGETTNIVATCGGKLVCLIDCQTGKVMKRYKDNSKSEVGSI